MLITLDPAQQAFQTSLNNTLLNGLTELLPGTSRLVPLAVSKIAPGYGSPVWRALGKKILTLKYSTEFTYDCGNGLKVVRRALVSKSSEQ